MQEAFACVPDRDTTQDFDSEADAMLASMGVDLPGTHTDTTNLMNLATTTNNPIHRHSCDTTVHLATTNLHHHASYSASDTPAQTVRLLQDSLARHGLVIDASASGARQRDRCDSGSSYDYGHASHDSPAHTHSPQPTVPDICERQQGGPASSSRLPAPSLSHVIEPPPSAHTFGGPTFGGSTTFIAHPTLALKKGEPIGHGVSSRVPKALPLGHKPARGRGRTKQLATMTSAQKTAEAAILREKNRQAACNFRQRRKNRIQILQASVAEFKTLAETRAVEITTLREEVACLRATAARR